MEKFLKKILVLFLTSLIVFSSIGFSVSAHLCGGSVVLTAVSIVKKELTCGMKKDNNKCPNKSHIRKICCQNIFDYFHIEEGLENTTESKPNKIARIVTAPNNENTPTTTLPSPVFKQYIPPILFQDLIIENQSFMI